ncbi:class I adenylate-forming enzyme family protein [Rhodococcoides yunnanense]|uniref:AMP-binding protein n=1 Tax=Rhodococcoides yunnanense TaxID=278209 RepID=A0ABU4BKH5_9NOCA|nr:AMP-binding protein [Rhodococcus yunnanensis]MDV6264715.1 AMP-binding protein [Rhodococcus yunnanensis]
MPSDLTLGQTICDNAIRFPDEPAYAAGDSVLTHSRLRTDAATIATALAARGIRRQDRVALLDRNTLDFARVLAAGNLSGVVVATINFRLAAREIVTIVADAAPRVLFFGAEYEHLVAAIRDELPDVELFVRMGSSTRPAELGVEDLDALLAEPTDQPPYEARGDDVACLIYTSGTTGKPKGCVLGQHEMTSLALTMNGEMRSGSTDKILLCMPLFHVGAMAMALGIHARGGSVVLHEVFDPARILATVADEQITVLHLAPTMLAGVVAAARITGTTLQSVRTVVYSAAPITRDGLADALEAMPNVNFMNLYGQTEVITSGLPPELHRSADGEADARRLVSVGYPFPGTRVRIVADNGDDAEPGRPGEIAVRCEAMFRGYWNDSVRTAEVLRDGWCHTGDIGVVDDGLLFLVDRKKDVVISGGENVYSLEVENALTRHPQIDKCAVIGTPDPRWGEAVTAVIVGTPDSQIDSDEIRAFVRTQLAGYKCPRKVFFVSSLPTSSNGKIDKKALRVAYSETD